MALAPGYKTGLNNLKNEGDVARKAIDVYPWSGAGEVLDPDKPIIPGDRDSPKNADQYVVTEAQSWFRLRTVIKHLGRPPWREVRSLIRPPSTS